MTDDLRDRIATIVAGLRAVDYGEVFPSDYETADALIAALPGLQGWQPIETAPKDGTNVLINCEYGVLNAYWSDNIWAIVANDTPGSTGAWVQEINRSDTVALHPTHWMSLPDAPAAAGKEGE